MPITFQAAQEVAVGDKVTSRHLWSLSEAVTQRVLSGLGDGAKRYLYWWHSQARQIRNPDASGTLFPAEAEYLEVYQHLDPRVPWPEAGPGEPEGPNVASILGAFAFGNEAAKIDAEGVRLTDPESGGIPLDAVTTLRSAWELGKAQRGAYLPEEGMLGSPSFSAARSHFSLIQSPLSPHGNSYGGFFPTPEYLGECLDGTVDFPASPNYQIQFTSLVGGGVRTYSGTCPDDPTGVAKVIPNPTAYYVVLNDGTVDYLDRSQWIEGPYSGGNRLSKAEGGMLPRVLNRFAGEFRGTEDRHRAELAGQADSLEAAFRVDQFLTKQYLLAPAYGAKVDEETVIGVYPTATLSGVTSAAPGSRIGASFGTHAGFVIAAILVEAHGLLGSVVVQLREGEKVVATATLKASDKGNAEALVILRTPVRSADLRWVLPQGVRLSVGGGITCEAAELWEYKPGVHDLMLVCRVGGARLAGPDGTDGSGLTADDAREIWDSYRRLGCIARRREDQELPPTPESIGSNAVVDLFRRWANTVRVIQRHQLRGYAVEGGKSVLWIDPYVYGLSRAARADALAGIRDAIASKAPKGGLSNRWCLFPEPKRYRPNEESIWKESVYADWRLFADRCVTWTPVLPALDVQLQRHFNNATPGDWGAKRSYSPEVVSGYRYAKGLNAGATEEFYRSCRLYEPPVEIESAVTVTEGGAEVVQVTLTGRLHHHHSLAPASIARDITTWDRATIQAEALDYRTEENAIREYLLHAADNTLQCERTGPGNAAAASDILLGSDIPWGACMPHLCLVQLPPSPYADGNDTTETSDTAMTHEVMSQIELWIRVLSEGFVDGQTTLDYGCQTGIDAVYDFRFENLCFQAAGSQWLPTLASTPTTRLKEAEVRPDRPMGFGPLPTVRPSAETHNLFARAMNLLTRVRVMLPFRFEARTLRGTSSRSVAGVTTAAGSPSLCPGGTAGFVFLGDPGDAAAETELFPWDVAGYAAGLVAGGFSSSGSAYICDGDHFVVGVVRDDQEYRWKLVDPAAEFAMPETWRSMVETDGEFLATVITQEERIRPVTDGVSPTTCNGLFYWDNGVVDVEYRTSVQTTTECLVLPTSGRAHAPKVGETLFIGASGTPICTDLPASTADNSVSITPVPTDALILRIPLVDAGEEQAP